MSSEAQPSLTPSWNIHLPARSSSRSLPSFTRQTDTSLHYDGSTLAEPGLCCLRCEDFYS